MLFLILLSLLVITLPSSAQSSTQSSPQSMSTSASRSSIISVIVGRDGKTFEPKSISADPGDVIMFRFWPGGHSVIKAAFGFPCYPFDYTYPGQPSFYSGNMSDTSIAEPKSWNLTVNDTSPVFFYCGAPDSCLGNQMIGVINANSTFTLAAQTDVITNGTDKVMLEPGEVITSETVSSSTSVMSSTTEMSSATPLTTTVTQSPAAATSTSPVTASKDSHVALSTGGIAGIAVGGAAVLALVGALFWYMSRSRILKQTLDQQRGSGFQDAAKGPSSMSYGGDGDSRWSNSYAGSPAPEKRMAQPMETVYDIDRHGSPELEGWSAPEIGAVAGYPLRGRRPDRSSATSELWTDTDPGRGSRSHEQTRPVHEIG